MAALTEWLQLMLAEIARKNDELDRARAEEAQRSAEKGVSPAPSNVTSVQELRSVKRR
ncbi:MAG TPA: hypothetical protein VI653_25880 [Steroidobacteraceae bacterium]